MWDKSRLWWTAVMLVVLVGCSGKGADSNETRQESETGFGNNIPVSQAQSLTLAEDDSIDILLAATDADEDNLTYGVTALPTHGTLEGTAPDLVYHPKPDYNGADQFSFTSNDGQVDSPAVAISLTVTPVNDAPDTQPDSASTDEDTAVMIDVLANDSDRDIGDSIHIASATTPAHGSTTIQNGQIRYMPAQDYHGADHFSYICSDGNGGETAAEVNVTVISVNDLPVSNPQSLTLAEDTTQAITLTASDVDGDMLSYHIVAQPTHGTLEGTAPDLVYHPKPDYNGADQFSFTSNDGQVDSPAVAISLTVTPVNDAPDTQPDSASTDEDTVVMIDVLANDSDRDVGDSIHIASATTPAHGSTTIQNGQIRYMPAQDYHGADHFSYICSDGNGGETAAEVNVTVISVNDVPVARAGDDMVIVQSETVTVDGRSSFDVDGDSLLYLWTQAGVEVSSAATFSYEGKEVGSFTFTLKVTDPEGASSSDTVMIEVTEPQNETPTEYRSTFVPQRPLISTPSGIAMDADIAQIKAEGDTLIEEAEALIADKHFTLDVTPLSDAQKDAITRRKAQLEQEVQNHGN